MKDKIAIICDGISFMVKSLANNLWGLDFEVKVIQAAEAGFAQTLAASKYVFVYVEDYNEKINIAVNKLREVYMQHMTEMTLFIAGDPNGFSGVHRLISEKNFAAAFPRPINLKELSSTLASIDKKSVKEKTLLVVDDDPIMLQIEKGWLEKDYNVILSGSGMDAISIITDENKKVDMVLLDYDMPGWSGPQVLEMIRAEERIKSTPVMFITGKGDPDSVRAVMELKPEGYFLKTTMSKEHLLNVIKEYFMVHKK